jgi:hypothetical protein
MGKVLLRNVIDNAEDNETAVASAEDNSDLSELMKEMRAHLQEAAKDLLQPRPQVIEGILRKALH